MNYITPIISPKERYVFIKQKIAQTLTSAALVLSVAASNTAFSTGSLCITELPTLPTAVANNAVASVIVNDTDYLISFAGIGEGLDYLDIHARTLVFNRNDNEWSEAAPVPGKEGRLAATAAAVGKLAYVFGGYTVAADGIEVSTPWVHSFDPVTATFEQLSPMPIPVDDAVSFTYQDRYIYLISGWHDLGNVNLVQRYDTQTDRWIQATPIPGNSLFGHAGGVVGNKIAYCDGVYVRANADSKRSFNASSECFIGIIDAQDSRRIDWRPIAAHLGLPRYRMAAAGVESLNSVLFVGGSENPYNFDGMGYDGKPSEPAPDALLFNVETLQWKTLKQGNAPSMDHRGLVPFKNGWVTVGGMEQRQTVSKKVVAYYPEQTKQVCE